MLGNELAVRKIDFPTEFLKSKVSQSVNFVRRWERSHIYMVDILEQGLIVYFFYFDSYAFFILVGRLIRIKIKASSLYV
jgi:hypothetical protein